MSEIKFDGRVAIVTGAGNGLGRAYAIDLARRGARVVVNDLGGSKDGRGASEAAALVVDEIKAFGGDAVPSFASVATEEGGASIVKTAIDAWGRVDVVIGNAGFLRDVSFAKLSTEVLDSILDVHLRAAFFVFGPAFRAMKDAGNGGRLVATTSASGVFGNFGQANYGAAKMGLVGLVRTLAIEGAKYNIATNAICPVAATRLTLSEDGKSERRPAEVWGPESVAPLVTFLSHPSCDSNGEVFLGVGGWYSRIATLLGAGAVIPRDSLSAEAVQAHWQEIRDVGHALELKQSAEITALLHEKLKLN